MESVSKLYLKKSFSDQSSQHEESLALETTWVKGKGDSLFDWNTN